MKKTTVLILCLLAMSDVFALDVRCKSEITTRQTETGLEISLPDDLIVLSGSFDGTISIKGDNDYTVRLENVNIEADGVALKLGGKAKNVYIELSGENHLTDKGKPEQNWKKGVINVNPDSHILDLTIRGDGSLDITASKKHGIKAGYSCIIESGTVNINVSETALGDGIKAGDAFIMAGGSLTINALGCSVGDESKGINVEGHEWGVEEKGYIPRPFAENAKCLVRIDSGEINITSTGKGITAGWEGDEDGITGTHDDDPEPLVLINGGVVKVRCTGELRTSGTKLSPEGIESKGAMIINDGFIEVNAIDDGLNASSITINNGLVIAESLKDDGIDCNGILTVNGGVVFAMGDRAPSSGIDCDHKDNFHYNGGDIISIGGMAEELPPGHGLGIGYYKFFQDLDKFPFNTLYLLNKRNEAVLVCTIPSRYNDFTRLSLFIASDKTEGKCDIQFRLEENQ